MNRNESESMNVIENHNDGIRQQTEQWNESRLIVEKGITLNDEECRSGERNGQHEKREFDQSVDGKGLVKGKGLRDQFASGNDQMGDGFETESDLRDNAPKCKF